ncbi:MAG: helix-turn-helix domain-containing protein [Alphaproteobacteria bacterium]|jgi:predicted site-specific integrase-resolvase|nr:helix-turn-helix domain-containing protein [Alphaproteobacteria bacterium]
MNVNKERLLNTEEAAEILGIKPNTLKQWRCNDTIEKRINYIKISNKIIRYKLEDINNFIKNNYISI